MYYLLLQRYTHKNEIKMHEIKIEKIKSFNTFFSRSCDIVSAHAPGFCIQVWRLLTVRDAN